MKWFMFVVFSAIAAILFGPVNTWVNTQSLKADSTGAQNFFSSYFGKTAILAASFFVVLIGATFVMKLVGKGGKIPVPVGA